MVDGVLKNWHLAGNRLYGEIFSDRKNRFPDGTQVSTSVVMTIHKDSEGRLIANTLRSIYLLG